MSSPKRTPAAQNPPKSQKVPAVVTTRCKSTNVFETINEVAQFVIDTIDPPRPRNFAGKTSLEMSHGSGPTPMA